MPRLHTSALWIRVSLLSIAVFNVLSAAAGGWGLTSGGLVEVGLPLSLLDNSPFETYLWPGVILIVFVGGPQALALWLQVGRRTLATGMHAVAGCAMLIWIFVELAMIEGFSVLHAVYFGTGLVQVILVILALGAWPHPFWGRER